MKRTSSFSETSICPFFSAADVVNNMKKNISFQTTSCACLCFRFPSMSLSIYLSVCLSVSLSVCLSACLPACLPVCLSFSLARLLSYVCLPASLFLSLVLSVCLSPLSTIHASVCLSVVYLPLIFTCCRIFASFIPPSSFMQRCDYFLVTVNPERKELTGLIYARSQCVPQAGSMHTEVVMYTKWNI